MGQLSKPERDAVRSRIIRHLNPQDIAEIMKRGPKRWIGIISEFLLSADLVKELNKGDYDEVMSVGLHMGSVEDDNFAAVGVKELGCPSEVNLIRNLGHVAHKEHRDNQKIGRDKYYFVPATSIHGDPNNGYIKGSYVLGQLPDQDVSGGIVFNSNGMNVVSREEIKELCSDEVYVGASIYGEVYHEQIIDLEDIEIFNLAYNICIANSYFEGSDRPSNGFLLEFPYGEERIQYFITTFFDQSSELHLFNLDANGPNGSSLNKNAIVYSTMLAIIAAREIMDDNGYSACRFVACDEGGAARGFRNPLDLNKRGDIELNILIAGVTINS